MPLDNELTQVSVGQPFMEFLSIMINKLGAVIAWEVIRGMLELSSNPVSLYFGVQFLLLHAFLCMHPVLFFLLILCTVQSQLMNSPLLIGMDNKDRFVPQFLINAASPGTRWKAIEIVHLVGALLSLVSTVKG